MNNTAAADRRRMTSAELAVWRSLIDTTTELRRRLATRLAAESGLSTGDYAVLLALSEAPGRRLRSSELAGAIDWERGLIQRVECATDSRGAEVVLTEDGARIFRNATAPHARAIKQHFADALSPAQFDALDDILRTITTHLEASR
jgi:DNA-binding MarR family transcriptional regulator